MPISTATSAGWSLLLYRKTSWELRSRRKKIDGAFSSLGSTRATSCDADREPTCGPPSSTGACTDVLALFADRVALALAEEKPEFGWWDHEAAAVDEGYNELDRHLVAAGLRESAERLVSALPRPTERAWQRAGTRRGRERFTVEGLARFALHEVRHHCIDAERALT